MAEKCQKATSNGDGALSLSSATDIPTELRRIPLPAQTGPHMAVREATENHWRLRV